jgi:hypothetical protein
VAAAGAAASTAPAVPAGAASVQAGSPADPLPPVVRRTPLLAGVPRRTLVLGAVVLVVVLVVLATVVAVVLSRDGETGGKSGGKSGSSGSSAGSGAGSSKSPSASAGTASAGSSAGQDGTGDQSSAQSPDSAGSQVESAGTSAGTSSDASAVASASAGTGDSGTGEAPAGYKAVTDAQFHFTIALPDGWNRTRIAGANSGGIYSASGGFPRVQVDYTGTPGNDALGAWTAQEATVKGSWSGYQRLRLEKVAYRDYPTVADWEFERQQNGQAVRVLNRGFKMDATHGYAIMITCLASEWDGNECKTLRDTAFATFQPTD